ncbi:MAG: efflux RND transporter periplasmic adaptor subunit [Proteobacteria bacterium]|nr:efflux RND transporter periplasmic adaptor subunit [Pseudomonadota bacterium]
MTTEPAPPRDGLPEPWSRQAQLRALLLVGVALAAVAILAWLLLRSAAPGPAPAAAPAGTFRPTPQQLKALTIEAVATHRFATVEVADGRIAVDADRATPVYSPFTGRIVALVRAAGDAVTAGAPLAWIEAAEYAQARSDLASAAAQARLATATLERKRALLEEHGASLAEVQQAESDAAGAAAALSAARARLAILGLDAPAIDALAASAAGDARVALRAPIAGVIVDRAAAPGQYLQAGTGTALYTIADTRRVWAVGAVREGESAALRRGQPVEVRVAAAPARRYATRLDYVGATVDPATHRVTVRATLDNGDGALRPEMLATLSVVTAEAAAAVAVPESAVVYDGERAHVWVVDAGDAIGLREIRAGRRGEGLVEVLDGLRAGERVVTRGSLFIDRAARRD